jgi:hypothetical protein
MGDIGHSHYLPTIEHCQSLGQALGQNQNEVIAKLVERNKGNVSWFSLRSNYIEYCHSFLHGQRRKSAASFLIRTRNPNEMPNQTSVDVTIQAPF